MTKEEYVQKAISEAKSTSGAVYAILALMEEVQQLRLAINEVEEAVILLRGTIDERQGGRR